MLLISASLPSTTELHIYFTNSKFTTTMAIGPPWASEDYNFIPVHRIRLHKLSLRSQQTRLPE
jgi:hypothetical protein